MSAFLILLGLYYSAISVANDSDLRREIKRSVIKETKLLGSMGEAQMEQELEKKVMKLTNDKTEIMIEQTGIQPSLSIDEAREYLYEVMEEGVFPTREIIIKTLGSIFYYVLYCPFYEVFSIEE